MLSLGASLLADASVSEELLAGSAFDSALDSALDSLAASLLEADDELAVLCVLELLSLLEEAVLCALLELEDEDVLPEDAPELLALDELLELPMMLMVKVLLLTEQSL